MSSAVRGYAGTARFSVTCPGVVNPVSSSTSRIGACVYDSSSSTWPPGQAITPAGLFDEVQAPAVGKSQNTNALAVACLIMEPS